jgi:hypothetical protein
MNQKIHIFTFFQYATSIINSLKGFIFVIFLTPEAFGLWRTFYTTINYARYFDLGISTFSYYRGLITSFRKSYTFLIWRSVFILILPSSILFSLLAYRYVAIFDQKLIIMMFAIFFLSFSVQFYASIASIYKINKNINSLIIMDVSLASVSLVLSCILGFFFNLKGILLGMVASYIIVFICLYFKEKNNFYTKIRPIKYFSVGKRFCSIVPKSFIYYLPGAVSVLFINVDLWFGANSVSKEIAGYFGLFMGFQILVSIAPSSISTWFYIEDAPGLNNSMKKLVKVCSINFLASSFVALIGLLGSYLLITNFLNEYMQTFYFISAIFWTLPFFALRNILVNILIIRNQSLQFSTIVLLLVCIKIVLFSLNAIDLNLFINIVQISNIAFTIAIIGLIVISNKKYKV